MRRARIPVLVFAVLGCGESPEAPPPIPVDPRPYVDPFVGTGGDGNTFPGAVVPWGLASFSPHNRLTSPVDYIERKPLTPSGYRWGEPEALGFGLLHLSGVGCNDWGVPTLAPTVGVKTVATPEDYRSALDEKASPGHWKGTLERFGIDLEATVGPRSGIVRLEYPAPGQLHVDVVHGVSWSISDGAVEVDNAGDGVRVTGEVTTGAFCLRPGDRTLYFALTVDGGVAAETGTGARIDVDAGVAIARFGLSFVSRKNALENLESEVDGPFDEALDAAEAAWSDALGRIRVFGGTEPDRTRFFTALYHTLIHPSVFSDVNGQFVGMDGEVHTAGESPRYTVFSLWDTYRTLHPLLLLAYPDRQRDMLRSMVQMAQESGAPPRWELGSREVNMMVGDPATIVVAQSAVAGLSEVDYAAMYDVMRDTSHRIADAEYKVLGYVPMELKDEAWGPVSTTLEYALADHALATLAAHLSRDDDAAAFAERADRAWRALLDETTWTLRPKHEDGSWLEPYDPDAREGSTAFFDSGGPGFVEGTAWDYAYFVLHDLDGLADAHGGVEPFLSHLDALFDAGRFEPWNEPPLHYPWIYAHFEGHAARAQTRVADALDTWFGTGPEGLPGNDDAGTMSAWVVWAMLGLYPLNPAGGEYVVTRPRFDRIELGPLVIEGGEGTVPMWNDVALERAVLTHDQLTEGGVLSFRNL